MAEQSEGALVPPSDTPQQQIKETFGPIEELGEYTSQRLVEWNQEQKYARFEESIPNQPPSKIMEYILADPQSQTITKRTSYYTRQGELQEIAMEQKQDQMKTTYGIVYDPNFLFGNVSISLGYHSPGFPANNYPFEFFAPLVEARYADGKLVSVKVSLGSPEDAIDYYRHSRAVVANSHAYIHPNPNPPLEGLYLEPQDFEEGKTRQEQDEEDNKYLITRKAENFIIVRDSTSGDQLQLTIPAVIDLNNIREKAKGERTDWMGIPEIMPIKYDFKPAGQSTQP